MRRSTQISILAMLALAGAGGCASKNEPVVESFENGVYHVLPVHSYEISGARDGAQTRATALFTLEDGGVIRVELEVAYNPTPVLNRGHWRYEGKTIEEGDVHDESLKFLGGQGAKPSVGGRFRLETNGAPRWRVTMPTRPVG